MKPNIMGGWKRIAVMTLACSAGIIFAIHSHLLNDNSYTMLDQTFVDYNMTTCSERAFKRGSGQKVVAFVFYGGITSNLSRVRGYFEGIKDNLRLVTRLYSGYMMRVYIDVAREQPTLKELNYLMRSNSNLDICDVNSLPGSRLENATRMFPMVWRFFPILDPQVDVFFSRDLDSRITEREVAAVSEFLQSGMSLHSMRDHPHHGTHMLGGLWGSNMVTEGTRNKLAEAWTGMMGDTLIWASRSSKGPDQTLLFNHVWRVFGGAVNILQHDSYLCEDYPGSLAWPTKRLMDIPNNFVGAIVNDNATLTIECPKACRPKDKPHWKFC